MIRLKWSAAYRIAFAYSATFALAVLVLATVVYLGADREFSRQQDVAIAGESIALIREFREGGLPDLSKAIAKREARNVINAYGYAVFDHDGRRVAGALDTARPEAGRQNIVFADSRAGSDPARALATDLPDGSRLVVARDTETLWRIDRTILLLFGGAFTVVIAMGVLGALILGGYLRGRLRGISEATAAIIAGDLNQRVPLAQGNDEFDQVGRALNLMLDRITRLMENLRQVSSNIAHDLRTPLLRLRNQLEQVGTMEGAAGRAIEQGDALLALFASILRIAEIESGTLTRGFMPTDVSVLATDMAESYAPALIDGGRVLTWTIADDILVIGDRTLLAQAIINLLDNAGRHTPPGTRIELALSCDAGFALLSIADDGPGVDNADYDRILQRFFRGEASRTTPGNGLGLSLVAAVAAAHGGHVAVNDNGPGFRLLLTLPRLLQ
jgi:signal transduction histidine kinase